MADQAGTIKVSLRAVDGFDTTCVTQAYGGGGHRAASSCLMPQEAFQKWQVGQQQGGGS
jgi:nanoRNase/pAp phosphatase (c-di-AMP/oligoRNAs hydrolase)